MREKNKTVRYLLLLPLVVLTSCLHLTKSVPVNYNLNESENGLVALSLVNVFEDFDPEKTLEDEGVSFWLSVNVNYRKVGHPEFQEFKAGGALISPDGGLTSGSVSQYLDNPYGLLILAELPEGEYEVGAPHTALPGYKYHAPSRRANFTVKKGQITYIGEYGISVSRPNIKTLKVSSYVRDGRKRDIAQLLKTYTQFDSNDVFFDVQPMSKKRLGGKSEPIPHIIYVPGVRY